MIKNGLGLLPSLCLFTQNAAVYSTRVHTLGRYVFILHYHQPLHPTYPVQVYINGGRIWQGKSSHRGSECKCLSE